MVRHCSSLSCEHTVCMLSERKNVQRPGNLRGFCEAPGMSGVKWIRIHLHLKCQATNGWIARSSHESDFLPASTQKSMERWGNLFVHGPPKVAGRWTFLLNFPSKMWKKCHETTKLVLIFFVGSVHFGGWAGFLDLSPLPHSVIGLPTTGRYWNIGKKTQWDMENIWKHINQSYEMEKRHLVEKIVTHPASQGRSSFHWRQGPPAKNTKKHLLEGRYHLRWFPMCHVAEHDAQLLGVVCPKKSWIEYLVAGGHWLHLDGIYSFRNIYTVIIQDDQTSAGTWLGKLLIMNKAISNSFVNIYSNYSQ